MKTTQIQNYQMFTRVVEFTTNNVSLFPKTSAVAEILAELKSTVDEMSKQAGTQAASEGKLRESQAARASARESLKRRLMLTGQVADAMNSDKFPTPARWRDHDMISTAHAFVENGAALSKEFIRHALPLNELEAAIEALERANMDAYSSAKAERASAVRQFGITTLKALGYLQRLDAIVEITLSEDPAALASWKVARKVTRTAVRKRAVKPSDTVPADTVPAVTLAAA